MTTENPLISIYMPTWNRQQLAIRAIKSVLRQDYPHWEMITNIKDIDYFFGVMMAIYALYLGAGAVHFGYFKILKRKQMVNRITCYLWNPSF